MMCSGMCTYKVSVNMTWSPETHPIDFPMDPMGFVFPFWTVPHDKTCGPPPPGSCLPSVNVM